MGYSLSYDQKREPLEAFRTFLNTVRKYLILDSINKCNTGKIKDSVNY